MRANGSDIAFNPERWFVEAAGNGGPGSFYAEAEYLADTRRLSNAIRVLTRVVNTEDAASLSPRERAQLSELQNLLGKYTIAEEYSSRPPDRLMQEPDGVDFVATYRRHGRQDLADQLVVSRNAIDQLLQGTADGQLGDVEVVAIDRVLDFLMVLFEEVMLKLRSIG